MLNIGAVNFGVDANTQGLQKAVQQLDRFQRKTDQIAKSQAKGAQATVAAMTRQESAIKRAFQQTLNLQREQRKLGASSSDIARVSNAFRKLTKEMTSGSLTQKEYTRSVDAFAAKLGRARREMKKLQDEARKNKVSKFTETIRNLESASVLAVGPLSGLGARIRALGAIFNRSTLRLAVYAASVTAALVAVGKLTQAMIQTAASFGKADARAYAATGSMKQAAVEMDFIRGTSRRLALDMDAMSLSFTRFMAASHGTELQGERSRKVFLGMAKAAAALRLDGMELTGIIRAAEQMMSKGTVQAEELRGQMGDRLPGAFLIAARAMGVTTKELNKMLKNGEVIASEFLPLFATELEKTFGKQARDNMNSYQGALNAVKNEFQIFAKVVDDKVGASGAYNTVVKSTASVLGWLAEAIDETSSVSYQLVNAITDAGDKTDSAATSALKLTKEYERLTSQIASVQSQYNILVTTADLRHALGTRQAIEEFQTLMTIIERVKKLSSDDRAQLAFDLGLDDDSIESIARTMARTQTEIDNARRALKEYFDQQREAERVAQRIENITAKTQHEIQVLRKRNEALAQGRDAYTHYTQVTEKIDNLRYELEKAGVAQEEINRLITEYGRLIQRNGELQQQTSRVSRQAGQAIMNTMEDVILGAENAKDAVKGLIRELIRLALRQAVLRPLLGSVGSALGVDLAGTRAVGGHVQAHKRYLVGETGPEIFTPPTRGTITSNRQLESNKAAVSQARGGGGGISITNYNDFTGVAGVTRTELQAGLKASEERTKNEIRQLQRRRRF